MSPSPGSRTLASALLALCAAAGLQAARAAELAPRAALGSSFTFQGRLMDDGSPANGAFDLEFRLYDDSGNPAGDPDTVALEDVALVDGLFTVELDFGAAAFDGQARNLEIGVRPGASTGAFTPLAPRQRLTAAPQALALRTVQLETRTGSAFIQAPETQVGTAGDPALVVADSASALRKGNLGIGTTTPAGRLHVVGDAGHLLRVEQTSNAANAVLELKDASPDQNRLAAINFLDAQDAVPGQILYSMDSHDLTLRVNSEERLRIDSSGRVGIGDGTPDAKLDVETASGPAIAVQGTSSVASGTGVHGTSSATDGEGVAGFATAATGSTYGVLGRADSTSGIGVFGWAISQTGSAYGVSGRSASSTGAGVLAVAAATSGKNHGLYGTSLSTEGTGVYGLSQADTGNTYGVHGSADSTTGRGVHGTATATSGLNYGVSGTSLSTSGVGVSGFASAATGFTRGMSAQSNSPDGIGLYASASSSTGSANGVQGDSFSASGRGVFGWARASSGTNYGVFGQSASGTGTGVYGYATSTTGVNRGVIGVTLSSTDGAAGVIGSANPASGQTYGVIGSSNSSAGLGGHFENPSSTGSVLRLRKSISSSSGNFITADRGSGDVRFRVNASGNVYADGSFNCGLSTEGACLNAGSAADLAERIDVTEALEPGDVVAIDPGQPEHFRLCREAYSPLVAGVVSTHPAITLGNKDMKDNDTDRRTDARPLLALAGRVPVKASAENGPIEIGDLLVSASTPGHVMRGGPDPPAGTVLGKALQPLSSGLGTLQILVQPH